MTAPDPSDALEEAAPPETARPSFMRRLKWLMIGALAVLEIGFDQLIEPWLRNGTAVEEQVERYLTAVEVLAIGLLLWLTFNQLERLERRLEQRRHDLAVLYREARAWDQELEALHEASVAIARDGAYPGVLSRIVALAAGLAGARFGALAEFDDAEHVVEFATYGVPDAVRERLGALPSHTGLLRRLSELPAVRVADVATDPTFGGFPAGHPGFRTFIGVPIRWEGDLLGHLYLGGRENEEPFTDDQERLLQMFAAEAAVAIRRARLESDAAARVRHTERRRIAMALHDDALQVLYALGLQLDRARRRGLSRLSDTMSVDMAVDTIQRSMTAIRGVLDRLDEDGDDAAAEGGLLAGASAAARMYGVELAVDGADVLVALGPEIAAALGPCLAEAVANAARHGGATRVQVRFDAGATGALTLEVRDNGRGAPAGGLVEGRGLAHVRARLQAMGGRLCLTAAPGAGLGWRCVLPLEDGKTPHA